LKFLQDAGDLSPRRAADGDLRPVLLGDLVELRSVTSEIAVGGAEEKVARTWRTSTSRRSW